MQADPAGPARRGLELEQPPGGRAEAPGQRQARVGMQCNAGNEDGFRGGQRPVGAAVAQAGETGGKGGGHGGGSSGTDPAG